VDFISLKNYGVHSESKLRKLRILHIHHALYIPYLFSKGARELGHKSDTLYFDFKGKSTDLTWGCDFNFRSNTYFTPFISAFFIYALFRYDVFHFWGKPYFVPATFNIFKKHFSVDLALLKMFRRKIVYSSEGCYTMIRPSTWKSQIDPEICHVCQTTQGDTYAHCSNKNTIELNQAMERYCDLRFGMGMDIDFEKNARYCFGPVDTALWNPGISIPKEFVYKKRNPDSVVIFHGVGSHVIGTRGNIKGTSWIIETIQQLQDEGYNVELMKIENVPNKFVRFYQVQADIVVDQLLIGGGGQNSRECLALGKPVLTRIHPQQEKILREAASPHYLPYVPVDKTTLKENLIRLIENPTLRKDIGLRSLEFAQSVLSPKKATERLIQNYHNLFSN